MPIRVGIVGFRGYSGTELVRILERHPGFEPWLLEHRSDAVDRPLPRNAAEPPRIACTPESISAGGLEAVCLATPADVSMELAPAFLEAGVKVVDLSGAFRLGTPEAYRRWYGADHSQPGWLTAAVYGLPEFYRDEIRRARLVANPGCYPTAANLAIRPLVESGVLDRGRGLICDAKSGVSGAGRKPSLKTHFCEVTENFSAYSILGHRHVPEVLMHSGLEESEFAFTAHLLPVHRGILETIYFRASDLPSEATLLEIYEKAYSREPFIRLYDPPGMPDIRSVQSTNFCDIGVRFEPDGRRAVVVAAIDNLVKGAAGQAVQNLNLLFGYPETEGLL